MKTEAADGSLELFFQGFATFAVHFLLEAKTPWCHQAPYPGWVTPVTGCAKAGTGTSDRSDLL